MRKNYFLAGLGLTLLVFFSLTALSHEESKEFTSTSVNNHTHTFTLNKADLDTPPAEGISRATSSSANHTHTVTLTKEQLGHIKMGMEQTVKTSIDSGHSHDFTFKWK
jgi:tRNA U34 5-carboxymethylaminomethyl modifying GTPase MnmE/TrmE